jgi:hypothetical protein
VLVLPAVLAATFGLDVAVPDEDCAQRNIGTHTRIAADMPRVGEIATHFFIWTASSRSPELCLPIFAILAVK